MAPAMNHRARVSAVFSGVERGDQRKLLVLVVRADAEDRIIGDAEAELVGLLAQLPLDVGHCDVRALCGGREFVRGEASRLDGAGQGEEGECDRRSHDSGSTAAMKTARSRGTRRMR
jgi:hypothetical protein